MRNFLIMNLFNQDMSKTLSVFLTAFMFCFFNNATLYAKSKAGLKPRIVVMTDIGPADVEPDDNESAVRLLAYADRFEIEAICTTVGWNCDPYPREWAEYLYRVIDAYEKDVQNLMKRSGQKGFLPQMKEEGRQELGYWPSARYIRSRTMMGSLRAGIGVIGEGNDSEGSEFVIKLLKEEDERPIWILSWGSSNTLAQALWKLKKECTATQLKEYLHKLRIYTITDQDMHYSMRMQRDYSSHMWMRKEFKNDLLFIWDESAWLNQNGLGKQNWNKYASLIQNKGEMGKVYPTFKWGVEGDTPSFLHVMPNGLNDPDDPTQVGWGGYHVYGISPDSITYSWTNWKQPMKNISDRYEKKFYPDEFNDFAARMQWAYKGKGNRNPVVIVNNKKGLKAIHMNVKTGKTLKLSANKSYDPDGDRLSFYWWQQPEAGTGKLIANIQGENDAEVLLTFNAKDKGKTVHLICEVHDDGEFNLVSYRRIVLYIK